MLASREEELSGLRLTSALDLREEPHACRKAAEKSVTTGIAVAPLELLPVSFCTLLPCYPL